MRTVTKRKLAVAVPALMAAGFSAWMGASSAKGDFVVTMAPAGTGTYADPYNPEGTFVSGGVTYVDYVVSAYNNGLNSTGTSILVQDSVVTTLGSGTSGAIFVDIYKKTSATSRSANITDTEDALKENGYGSAVDGTFAGLGNVTYDETTATNVEGILPGDTLFESFDNGVANKRSGSSMDANYISGTVHTLEIVSDYTQSDQPQPANTPQTAIPFLNVVIPVGTTATISGSLTGDSGPNVPFAPIYINPMSTNPYVSLTNTQPVGSTAIGPVLVSGGNSNYVPVVVPVSGAAQVFGSLGVSGWNPANDEEVYGLAITNTTAESLAQIAADLSAPNSTNPSNLVVETVASLPTGALKSLLQTDGDQLVAIFPTGASPNGSTNWFTYNLSSYNGSVEVTSITVVPEPTGIGALVLGGIGLLSRRKARKVA